MDALLLVEAVISQHRLRWIQSRCALYPAISVPYRRRMSCFPCRPRNLGCFHQGCVLQSVSLSPAWDQGARVGGWGRSAGGCPPPPSLPRCPGRVFTQCPSVHSLHDCVALPIVRQRTSHTAQTACSGSERSSQFRLLTGTVPASAIWPEPSPLPAGHISSTDRPRSTPGATGAVAIAAPLPAFPPSRA